MSILQIARLVLLLGSIAATWTTTPFTTTRILVHAFAPTPFRSAHGQQPRCFRQCGRPRDDESSDSLLVNVGNLLTDLPTPTLLIELTLAEKALNQTTTTTSSMSLDDYLQQPPGGMTAAAKDEPASPSVTALEGSIFVHTRITDTSARDRINQDLGSGKSTVIGSVDAVGRAHVPGGAFLGIGLSNHHVGGYYWARGMGIGASLEAHGVGFRDAAAAAASSASNDEATQTKGGELYWKKRDSEQLVSRGATTEESSNSNDGKRSEWADFLVQGDTVQLIPLNATRVLWESKFDQLVGVRRVGRPLGADPIVERVWRKRAETVGTNGPPRDNDAAAASAWIPL